MTYNYQKHQLNFYNQIYVFPRENYCMNQVNAPTLRTVCLHTSITSLIHELNWWHNTCPVFTSPKPLSPVPLSSGPLVSGKGVTSVQTEVSRVDRGYKRSPTKDWSSLASRWCSGWGVSILLKDMIYKTTKLKSLSVFKRIHFGLKAYKQNIVSIIYHENIISV